MPFRIRIWPTLEYYGAGRCLPYSWERAMGLPRAIPLAAFSAQPKRPPQSASQPQFFPCPGATRTVMVCSHIWWTEQIAYSFLRCGCNVLIHFPFYLLYTDPGAFRQFDHLWKQILNTV